MQQTAIFWPMIAHVVLVIGLYGLLGLRRKQAVEQGAAKISQFRENRDEPPQSLFVRNSLANQTELPPLSPYRLPRALRDGRCQEHSSFVVAWLFTISRYVHAFIHVTSNRIRYRQPAFLVGFVAVIVLWAALALHLLR